MPAICVINENTLELLMAEEVMEDFILCLTYGLVLVKHQIQSDTELISSGNYGEGN